MKKYLLIVSLALVLALPVYIKAQENLAQRLSGQILLQVESSGEAWYINPANLNRYYLSHPADAYSIMQNFGVGITNGNLSKIAIGIIEEGEDLDYDGLPDVLENVLGTNSLNPDSDNDGYNDKLEIENNYDPLTSGKLNIDENFSKENLGKIFLQTEKSGEAWYVNPQNKKRYYLGRPVDAFNVMAYLSLGILDSDLNTINIGYIYDQATPIDDPQTCPDCQPASEDDAISMAASAIRSGNNSEALTYFTENMHKAIEYTINFLSSESRLILGNILSGSKLIESTENKKTYKNEVYFHDQKIPVYFYVEKQEDGIWLLANL